MMEYSVALKLLCISQGWPWTLEIFLKNILKNTLEELSMFSNNPSNSPKEIEKSQKLLGFFFLVQSGIISHMCPSEEGEVQAKELIKEYSLLIKNINKGVYNQFF